MRGKKAKAIRRVVREAEGRALDALSKLDPDQAVPMVQLRRARKRYERVLKRTVK